MLKKEFATGLGWFENSDVFVDLGYLGFDKDYKANNIFMPHKKPRKSKKNPHPELSKAQKDENREMGRKRVVVENVIGGIKRFRCVSDRFRNHVSDTKDLFILLAAGLWNFNVANRS